MMNNSIRIFAIVAILLATTIQANAQKIFGMNLRIDSFLTARYNRADIDTNYITRPQTKWTLTGRLNMSGARIQSEGRDEGLPFETELTADYKTTISVGVSYLGLSLNLALNPAKLLGKYQDYELNFRSYSPRFGFDIAYQDAHNFKGWYKMGKERQDITTSEDMFKLRTLNVNAYYVFNHRKFSYPAAFAHSYIQHRSAGSFLLAASGQGQHGKVNGNETRVDGSGQTMEFKMTNIALGAGYGYNYVPGRGWLLHLSALPTFIVYSHTSLTMDGVRFPLHYKFPEVIITGRSAIVKQIGRNKFAGFSMIYNFTTIGDEELLAVHNQKWLARLYFGFRL